MVWGQEKPGTSEGITGLASQPPHIGAGKGAGEAPLLSSLAPRAPGKALHQGHKLEKLLIQFGEEN